MNGALVVPRQGIYVILAIIITVFVATTARTILTKEVEG